MAKRFRTLRPKGAKPAGEAPAEPAARAEDGPHQRRPREVGGPEGPEPTRYGDWERKGICVDF